MQQRLKRPIHKGFRQQRKKPRNFFKLRGFCQFLKIARKCHPLLLIVSKHLIPRRNKVVGRRSTLEPVIDLLEMYT